MLIAFGAGKYQDINLNQKSVSFSDVNSADEDGNTPLMLAVRESPLK
jgi:ankyrin repeat protein